MKTNRKCQIEKAVSTDATRPVLTHAYLRGDKLIATNGRGMVMLNVERDPHDVDGYVSVDALKAARKECRKQDHAELVCNGSQSLPSGLTFPRPTIDRTGTFPNCDFVWNQAWEQTTNSRISFDVRELVKLADAMGVDAVTLEMTDVDRVIRVIPAATRECPIADATARAILMPVRVS